MGKQTRVLIHDKNTNVMKATTKLLCKQKTNQLTRNRRDSTTDWSTCNAARLSGKIAENTVHNRDVIENQINRKKEGKTCKKMTTMMT